MHCDGDVDDYKAVCNDLKKCETDKDCGSLGYITTSGSAGRNCEDKGKGKKCYFDGGIMIT